MSKIHANGIQIRYKLEGTKGLPILVFSNSLGTDYRMWDGIMPALLPYFQILRYDTRGHGGTTATSESYSIELLGNDVLALTTALKIKKFAFCGLSMGGLIGQWLGIYHSEKLDKLIICNTASKIGSAETWNERIEGILKNGTPSIWAGTLTRWFTPAFHQEKGKMQAVKSAFLGCSTEGYAAACAAVRDADFREKISEIDVKTLIIAANQDPVTTVEHAEFMQSKIKNSVLKILEAAHLSSVEQPEKFGVALLDFLIPKMTNKTTYEKGMKIRRKVLGDAHVDRATANITDLNRDFQDLITRYAWGEIWTRDTLTHRDRSLITLSMLIALNREDEFKMHIRAAFNNGVTVAEIKEVIMQSAIYCGLPAANGAFHAAQKVFDELKINQ
jgi:3-oxoadipate enol-lactonase / 4-carboxymuconolactone decarboxylase